MRYARLFILLFGLLGPGCSWLSGVKVETARTVTRPPATVMVYLSVEERGEPVDHLETDNFQIYENDVLLPKKDLHLRLMPLEKVADGHTVLLIDLSGDIRPKDLRRIERGAAQFVKSVSTTQAVTVLVFDGSEGARLVARFPKVDAPTERPVPDLTPFVSGDASSNLNGAIVEALETLEEELARSKKPVQLGTLATLVRGPDLAGRKSEDDVYQAIEGKTYEYYSLSPADPPKEQKVSLLGTLGKDERFEYETMDTLPMVFQDLGMRVRAAWGRHYLVTYCTPARNGTRDVKVRVQYFNDRGDEKSGKGKTTFDATGFESGCGPMRTIVRIREEEARAEAEAQKKAEAEAEAARVQAEEAAKTRKRAAAARRSAEEANAEAERALEEPTDGDETPDDGPVVAPPSDGKYE
jgi:hypothetical protein